jgi:hypothetical protein
VAELLELLAYDSATGELRWRVRRANKAAGSLAGHASRLGYVQVGISYQLWLGHRVAWKMHYGTEPPEELDHINGNRLDNRVSNLRAATRSENNANSVLRADNTTGLKGVSRRNAASYTAQIGREGKSRYLGSFPTADAAHQAYLSEARSVFGPFVNSGYRRE